jgi:hypothetical protein
LEEDLIHGRLPIMTPTRVTITITRGYNNKKNPRSRTQQIVEDLLPSPSLPSSQDLSQSPDLRLPPRQLDLEVIPVRRDVGQLLLKLSQPIESALAIAAGRHGVALTLGYRVVVEITTIRGTTLVRR